MQKVKAFIGNLFKETSNHHLDLDDDEDECHYLDDEQSANYSFNSIIIESTSHIYDIQDSTIIEILDEFTHIITSLLIPINPFSYKKSQRILQSAEDLFELKNEFKCDYKLQSLIHCFNIILTNIFICSLQCSGKPSINSDQYKISLHMRNIFSYYCDLYEQILYILFNSYNLSDLSKCQEILHNISNEFNHIKLYKNTYKKHYIDNNPLNLTYCKDYIFYFHINKICDKLITVNCKLHLFIFSFTSKLIDNKLDNKYTTSIN